MEKNNKIYSSEKVVEYYNKYDSLQKPEQAIIQLLKADLKNMNMLDIGVGGGRTTKYFASLVKSYTGVDYSEKMVESCKSKFSTTFTNVTFTHADIRNLSSFYEKKFDFILFSFNGFDALEHKDRIIALNEIKKVLTPNGYFCFSTHNIRCLGKWKSIEFSLNPFALIENIIFHFKRKSINNFNNKKLTELQNSEYIMLNDGGHDWQLDTFYIQPALQIRELIEVGFKNIRYFSLDTGAEVSEKNIITSAEKWIYYLCQ